MIKQIDMDDKLKYIPQYHEWRLAFEFERALKEEDYEYCDAIKKEVDKRLEDGTINGYLMKGFRYYNPTTKQFEGNATVEGLNGLFEKYNFNS